MFEHCLLNQPAIALARFCAQARFVLAVLVLLLTGALPAAPAQRVISLAPHTTELVIAAGGRNHLVAAVAADAPLPPWVQRLPGVGGIDRERILALQPDLAVVWPSGNHAGDIAWLRRQGISVYASEPRRVSQVADDILALGRLMGTQAVARRAAARFLSRLNGGCGALSRREVYVEIWDHPAMSLGGRHWLNDALEHAGLTNTFAEVARGVFSVEREALLAREALPRLRLRDGSALGSKALGRPGPGLAEAVRQLCRQRQRLSGAAITPR
jgi:iron complex transport system substrate-binding protein